MMQQITRTCLFRFLELARSGHMNTWMWILQYQKHGDRIKKIGCGESTTAMTVVDTIALQDRF